MLRVTCWARMGGMDNLVVNTNHSERGEGGLEKVHESDAVHHAVKL